MLANSPVAQPRAGREPRAIRRITPGRAALYVGVTTGLGILFRFPTPAMLILPFAGLGLVVLARRRRGGAVASIVFASGFLAQMTSIFVTPFTWPMRFGFFAALIGALVAMIAWQLRGI